MDDMCYLFLVTSVCVVAFLVLLYFVLLWEPINP